LDLLLRLCTPSELPPSVEWSPDKSNAEYGNQFEKELEIYSYCIPPNFSDRLAARPSSAVARKLEVLKLNSRLARLAKEKSAAQILSMKDQLGAEMDLDLDSVNKYILQSVVKVVTAREPVEGLAWGIELAHKFDAASRWIEFVPIASTLLFPTIFEPGDTATPDESESQLTQHLAKSSVIQQLTILKKYLQISKGEEATDDNQVINLLDEHKDNLVSVSATVNRGYLNALFRTKAFDTFYILATQLAYKTKGFPFERI